MEQEQLELFERPNLTVKKDIQDLIYDLMLDPKKADEKLNLVDFMLKYTKDLDDFITCIYIEPHECRYNTTISIRITASELEELTD